jgi:hypothetical protein
MQNKKVIFYGLAVLVLMGLVAVVSVGKGGNFQASALTTDPVGNFSALDVAGNITANSNTWGTPKSLTAVGNQGIPNAYTLSCDNGSYIVRLDFNKNPATGNVTNISAICAKL